MDCHSGAITSLGAMPTSRQCEAFELHYDSPPPPRFVTFARWPTMAFSISLRIPKRGCRSPSSLADTNSDDGRERFRKLFYELSLGITFISTIRAGTARHSETGWKA